MREIIYNKDRINLDDGVFFGRGVFETIYSNGKLAFLSEHISRLKSSMKILNMEELEEEKLLDFINSNKFINGAVKILVTEKNIIITERKSPYNRESYEKGFNITYSSVLRNTTSILSKIKSINYIENIIEKQKAVKAGYNDVIFLNEKGFISESSCANIFIVKNDKIFTPDKNQGLLSGIIRNWIVKNYEVEEKAISKEEIENADEVFLTNSLMGIMSVKRLNNIKYSQINKAKCIMAAYEETINKYTFWR